MTPAAVAAPIPIPMIATALAIATIAPPIPLTARAIGMTRMARMLARSLAPLPLIAPSGARSGRGARLRPDRLGRGRGHRLSRQHSFEA
jgi:hypothetical protein